MLIVTAFISVFPQNCCEAGQEWDKAIQFVLDIYSAMQAFPGEDGLTNQLRRSAVSVPSNIAEGQARFSAREFHHFLSHSRGSLVEIETQVLIAQNVGYFATDQASSLLEQTNELGRILNGLIGAIKPTA